MDKTVLEKEFAKGETPHGLDGFYKGTLLTLFPQSPREHAATFLSHFFVPWKGKCFYKGKQAGDNILPPSTKPFIKLYPQKLPLGIDEFGGYHSFPFKTFPAASLDGGQKVLRLDYDLAENPHQIRDIIDELVRISENFYLGKVFIKEKNNYRLVGFFKLKQ